MAGSSSPDEAIVRLCGELDLAGKDEASAALAEAESLSPGRVILDLEELTFIDSSGVSFLVQAHRSVDQRGGELVITGATGFVLRVLGVMGLDRRLPLVQAHPEG